MRQYVIRREIQPKKEGAKPYTKAPRIQRLITPQRLQRKRDARRLKKEFIAKKHAQKAAYDALVAQRVAEKKQRLAHHKA